ncbi:hypothetical protein [Siminovitchia sp. 179-K 8D1 HS]|uniref:hypothetical protein n=1 Tax=Siminovitchia sp. 179-K 8D1 HS TaxID=3142385 RepID=UPI0039A1A7A6
MSWPEIYGRTLDEFFHLNEERAEYMEFSDVVIFMTPSPSTVLQRISSWLHARLFHYLEGKGCGASRRTS